MAMFSSRYCVDNKYITFRGGLLFVPVLHNMYHSCGKLRDVKYYDEIQHQDWFLIWGYSAYMDLMTYCALAMLLTKIYEMFFIAKTSKFMLLFCVWFTNLVFPLLKF